MKKKQLIYVETISQENNKLCLSESSCLVVYCN
ncbi:hypothetical protein Leryth_025304 [Lithospermum erythrorhizon]|nr:hypothetical protein Leryth_025304 [Lithospermum erythrorhizon]